MAMTKADIRRAARILRSWGDTLRESYEGHPVGDKVGDGAKAEATEMLGLSRKLYSLARTQPNLRGPWT